jgi:hypothetical protein
MKKLAKLFGGGRPPAEEQKRLLDAVVAGDCAIAASVLDAWPKALTLVRGGGFGDIPLLGLAAFHGQAPMVALLLERGAPIDEVSGLDKATALNRAARFGFPAAAETLLRAGADPDIRDRDGCTPLMHTTMTVGKKKADPALASAILTLSKADVTITDKRGRTAQGYAEMFGQAEIAAMLRDPASLRAAARRQENARRLSEEIDKTSTEGISGPVQIRKPFKLRKG